MGYLIFTAAFLSNAKMPQRSQTIIFYQRLHSSTSFFRGMDAVAPGRETAMADALAASSSPSCTGIPSIIEEIKYPVKVSPAAVVSTAFTLKIP